MTGEIHLNAGDLDRALDLFTRSGTLDEQAECESGQALALQRRGQTELALGRVRQAKASLDSARALAEASTLATHLVVRVLASLVEARPDRVAGWSDDLAEMEVCAPCSIGFHVQATIASATGADLDAAARHLALAERLSGMWNGGTWIAAVWEARAALRQAAERPRDATRCRAVRDVLLADPTRPASARTR